MEISIVVKWVILGQRCYSMGMEALLIGLIKFILFNYLGNGSDSFTVFNVILVRNMVLLSNVLVIKVQ